VTTAHQKLAKARQAWKKMVEGCALPAWVTVRSSKRRSKWERRQSEDGTPQKTWHMCPKTNMEAFVDVGLPGLLVAKPTKPLILESPGPLVGTHLCPLKACMPKMMANNCTRAISKQ